MTEKAKREIEEGLAALEEPPKDVQECAATGGLFGEIPSAPPEVAPVSAIIVPREGDPVPLEEPISNVLPIRRLKKLPEWGEWLSDFEAENVVEVPLVILPPYTLFVSQQLMDRVQAAIRDAGYQLSDFPPMRVMGARPDPDALTYLDEYEDDPVGMEDEQGDPIT